MYNHEQIEKKWQKYWEENETFKVGIDKNKKRFYMLVEFPYPSGVGLHVGHGRVYTASDVQARFKKARGYNVLFPMGWDAFGAPAEQYAIKNHIHPSEAVKENIEVFKGQMKSLGLSIDWSREFSTTDPEYYKLTQKQFLEFYKAGLAYKAEKEINWCPNCKMGLSNEDAQGGVCERCGTETTKKLKNQWVLKMSKYADKLIDGLDDTDFLDKVKTAQINWIGKSIGASVNFPIQDTEDCLEVFTTRCDTLFGVTFMVISPEHPYIEKYKDRINNLEEIRKYQEQAAHKSEIERTDNTKEKTGVVLQGLKAINPVNNQEIPIWVSDYVLSTYGTGAIMAVPAHDDRDYEFAKKFNIPMIQVLEEETGQKKENETKKNSIVAVLYDDQSNQYLTINWHENGGRLLIGGTIKEKETPLECAIREIKEETGYTNFELVKEGFKINHHYYAYNKNQYFNIECTTFLFKLNSMDQQAQQLDNDEKFDIEWVSKDVIEREIKDELHQKAFQYVTSSNAMIGDGIHIHSDFINGLNKEDAIHKMLHFLEKNQIGKQQVNYRLQDWIFSRQRFWGEPIPMIHCDDCGWVPVPDEELPVVLPNVQAYEPTDTGESPLANITDWVNVLCPKCGKQAKRETDTMPNWAGSSWYWLRYMDPHNENEIASKEALDYFGKVDLYDGGMEHATRHLLYARFWNIFLHEQGFVPNSEPFLRRISHGMILGPNGDKMSKSKGNVVNPNDMIKAYGADALRTYEMFIGDYSKDAAWNESGLRGCHKFLNRVWNLQNKLNDNLGYTKKLETIIHKTIKKVTEDIDRLDYNTAVSALMILLNEYEKEKSITKEDYRIIIQLLNPFAPHITEEINEICSLGDLLCNTPWPVYDSNKVIEETYEMVVQVNGKVRGKVEVERDTSKEDMEKLALDIENVKNHIEGKEISKVIVVPKKLVNIVVK